MLSPRRARPAYAAPHGSSGGRHLRRATCFAATLLASRAAIAAQYNFTGPDQGLWNTAANWTFSSNSSIHSVPSSGEDANLGLATSVSVVNFNANYSLPLSSLTLDSPGHSSITLSQTNAFTTMLAATELLGTTVTANFYNQSAGVNTTNNLILGSGVGGSGVYNLSGTGQLNTGNTTVGYSGASTSAFNQTGGTHTFSSSLNVGAGAVGQYNLSGGLLSFGGTDSILIGKFATGFFGQNGGTVSATGGFVTLQPFNGASATYNMSAGLLTGISQIEINPGNGSTGTFNQSGGTVIAGTAVNNLTGTVYVDQNSTGVGGYALSGTGALYAKALFVGQDGSGVFAQTGGSVTLSGDAQVGYTVGSTGLYTLSAGSLNVSGGINIGLYGNGGTFIQSGGSVTTSTLWVARGAAVGQNVSQGSYRISGGTLVANSNFVLGYDNGDVGTFVQTGGTVTVVPASGVILGESFGGAGIYTMDNSVGASSLTASKLNLGAVGSGTFTQTAGIVNITSTTIVGNAATAAGTYNLNGGTLTTPAFVVGNSGTGTVNQFGGTVSATSSLAIGSGAGSTGNYTLFNGTLISPTVNVGVAGTGSFTQSGGTATITTVSLNYQGGGGTYNFKAGTLSVTGALYINLADTGTASFINNGGVLNLPNNPGGFQAGFVFAGGTFTENAGIVNGYLLNQGTYNQNGGTHPGTFENGSVGIANINGFIYYGTALKNSGTLNAYGQVGTLAGAPFDNYGVVNLIGTGQIFSLGPVTNYGTIQGTGSIGGTGFTNYLLVSQGAGNLIFSATGAQNFGTFSLAQGRIFTLNSTLGNSGAFALNGALVNGAGTLSNSATGTVTGPGSILSAFSNAGTLAPGTGNLLISLPWNNSGTAQLSGIASSLNGGAITNFGTIQGLGIVGAPTNNQGGTIEPIAGTLTLASAVTTSSTSTIAISTGAKLLLSQGLPSSNGLISLSGGTFDANSQTVTNTSTGQITGYGILRSGGLRNLGSITFTGGQTTINGPVTNDAAKTIRIQYNPATFTGAMVNNGSIIVTSTNATFAGGFSGGAAMGSGVVAGVGSAIQGTGSLTVAPSSLLTTDGFIQSGVTLQAGAQLLVPSREPTGAIPATGRTVGQSLSIVSSLSLGAGANLNLTNNDLLVTGMSETAVRALVASWYNNGARNGTGLSASESGTGSGQNPYTSLAVVSNNNLLGNRVTAIFDNALTAYNDVFVEYTYTGDTNLDGKVNVDDLNALVLGLTDPSLTGWRNGDLNYDGAVTLADLTLLNSAMTHQGAPFGASLEPSVTSAAVPEPMALPLLILGAAPLSRRARRK